MTNFQFLDKTQADEMLSQLFEILYANMNTIAPTGEGYAEDKRIWLSNVGPAIQKEPRQIILMYAAGGLAGYFQYYINGGIFMVEEIQVVPLYQRTTLFYGLCRFLAGIVPRNTEFIEAYADKRNLNSQRIIEKLGMKPIGENKTGTCLHYRGKMDAVRSIFDK